jgi:hypothetical protein
MMQKKRGTQQREKKHLSAVGLLSEVRKVFKKIPSTRSRNKKVSLTDSLMSALAMFSLKSSSLLAFDKSYRTKMTVNNLGSLYGIKHAPSDTYMREELDEVDPSKLRIAFLSVFKAAQRGKLLEQYSFLGSHLITVDGTGMFNSEKISCENCCEKHHRNGRTDYYHQVLVSAIAHPDIRQVIPLCPELINKQDGTLKNDCERRAMGRFLVSLKREHPRLNATILSDALYSNTPQVNEIKSFGYHFIINVKPKGNKTLFEFISGISLTETNIVVGKNRYKFRYVNQILLNNAKNAPLVNFLECFATEVKGKKEKEKHFTWVTDHVITNDNVYEIMRGGRTRWKIENETINTLKNQGYQFEHNFGHGYKNLTSVFAMLMVLAFFIDQIQEAACGLFKAALQKTETRRTLWEKVRSYFHTYFVKSWEDLFTAVGQEIGMNLVIPDDTS